MPVVSLALSPDLRAWRDLGLDWLYYPALEEESIPVDVDAACPNPALQADLPTERPARSNGAIPPDSAPTITDAEFVARLPDPWRRIFSRLRPAPLIWSYAELGQDLLENGDPRRSQLLKRLLGGLDLPRGSSAFLPLALSGIDPEERERAIFARLLRLLNGRMLILLGQEALALSPYAESRLQPYQAQIIDGRFLILLPDMRALQEDPARITAATAYLRSSLAKIKLPGLRQT
ncbi:MAG: hypothetical protein FWF99_03945 [Desulfovibrionaceae bacterium]|nr:hypothetical protein [Desulfovibrionaceae bacterium]